MKIYRQEGDGYQRSLSAGGLDHQIGLSDAWNHDSNQGSRHWVPYNELNKGTIAALKAEVKKLLKFLTCCRTSRTLISQTMQVNNGEVTRD